VTKYWDYVTGVIVKVIVPGVFLYFHFLFALMLGDSDVNVFCKLLEVLDNFINKWTDPCFHVRIILICFE